MSAAIKTLKDTSGNTIYPQTKAEAVYLNSNVDLETAVNGKAPTASPTFTGNPQAPTPASGDNSTKIATTEYVQSAISGFGAGVDVQLSATQPTGQSTGDLWFKIVD